MTLPTHPKIRFPIDLRVLGEGTEGAIYIDCPLGIAAEPLLLASAVGPLLQCMDGTCSVTEITERFSRFGATTELVERLVALLDERSFLDTPRYVDAAAAARRDYRALGERPPALAGRSYSANPETLRSDLVKLLVHPSPPTGKLSLLVTPHIDYHRGGACYGATFPHLARQKPDLILLLGTAHQYSPHLFHLTDKELLSPLGRSPSARNIILQLAANYGEERAFADEILHRKEHSLELQLPFLHHFLPEVPVIPILVGSFHHFLSAPTSPPEDPTYEDFVRTLATLLSGQSSNLLIIAGVDIAHVGRQFGDTFELTPHVEQQVKKRDAAYIEQVIALDKDSLLEHIAEDSDARRVCGYPSLYVALDILERLGRTPQMSLVDYRQASDRERGCLVSFAGIAGYER